MATSEHLTEALWEGLKSHIVGTLVVNLAALPVDLSLGDLRP